MKVTQKTLGQTWGEARLPPAPRALFPWTVGRSALPCSPGRVVALPATEALLRLGPCSILTFRLNLDFSKLEPTPVPLLGTRCQDNFITGF